MHPMRTVLPLVAFLAPNKKQVLGRDCERVDPWDDATPIARPRLKGSSLSFSVLCITVDPDIESCLVSVKVGPRGTWGSGVARKAVRAGSRRPSRCG
jgi:hypothetical protein